MEDKARKKRWGAGGFSLPELMLVMLILLLVGQIAAGGIATVIKLYQRTVDIANAQTYLNTTILALRSRLSLASEVTSYGEKLYLDPEKGYYKLINNDDGINVQYCYINAQSGRNETKTINSQEMKYPLFTGTGRLVSSYESIHYNPSTASFTVSNLQVKKGGETLATVDSYIIHTVNPSTG